MRLYQKTPLRNMILQMGLGMAAHFVIFLLDRIVLRRILSDAAIQYLGGLYDMLISLPASFILQLFLFYWLNRYTNERLKAVGSFPLKKAACFSLLMIGLNLISFTVEEFCYALFPTKLPGQLLALAFFLPFSIFVTKFVFYKGLCIETAGSHLTYGQFVKKFLRFIKEKIHLYLLQGAALFALGIIWLVICYQLSVVGWDILESPFAEQFSYLGTAVLTVVTVFPLLSEIKLHTAFLSYFTKESD